MACDAMHRLDAARKVAAYARHVMPRLAQQLHSWMQLQHGTWCHASIIAAAHKVAAYARHVMPRLAQQLHSWMQLQHGTWCRASIIAAAHKVAAYARHVMPRLAQQLHSWMQLQHGTWCHASISGCPRGSIRSACGATLSSTAALLDAAAAWHVMPCIDWLLPTRWQHTLGT
jgi:hypothetical protein